jgi:GMP synthase-like glutamine amidotransferase
LKLGILKTGAPPESAIPRFGGYPDMFKRLLGPEAYDYRVYAVDEGEWPETPTDSDAWLVTGSSAGAYDPLPWIAQLEDFLRAALGQRPLVGICFGHQIMAQAFGGQVMKSPKGWGVGEQVYEIMRPELWMDGAERIRLPGSHQDQVIEAPPGTEVIAASVFTPIGGLAWRDAPAISLQLHPEFEPAYAIALIESRRGTRFTDEEADKAIASYGGPDDRARVGGWINNFLLATA